jgi:hypothetical protein
MQIKNQILGQREREREREEESWKKERERSRKSYHKQIRYEHNRVSSVGKQIYSFNGRRERKREKERERET